MWSDNESDIDLLRFSYLSASVKEIILNPTLIPTTIGLFGDWGSGKSTLMKLIEKDLSKEDKLAIISFNGWLFEGYDDAKSALIGGIIHTLAEKRGLYKKCSDKVKNLLKRVDWLHSILTLGKYAAPVLLGHPHLSVALAGSDGINALKQLVEKAPQKIKELDPEELKKFFKDVSPSPDEIRCSIQKFRDDFQDLIKAAEIDQLIVFIDDLDRCLPNTVIDTLEAIRLFLFVSKTSFVIAADERIVEYAIKTRFPELQDERIDVGRNYMEKMIQFPIRIPPLSNSDIQSYMNILFAQKELSGDDFSKVKSHVGDFKSTEFGALSLDRKIAETTLKITLSQQLQDDFSFVDAIAPSLAPGLGGSPRRTKRFLNTLLIRLDMGNKRGLEVNRSIMAKLMLLEYVRTEYFRELARLQSVQDGFPKEIEFLEKQAQLDSKSTDEKNLGDIADLQKNYTHWLSDEWMKTWLRTSPSLQGINLKPYFYLAHDKVSDYLSIQEKLTPRVQAVFSLLLSGKELQTRQGLNDAKTLSQADANALFSALSERVRQADKLDKTSPQDAMFNLMESQPSLVPQLITLYNSISETKIQLDAIPKMLTVAKNPTYKESVKSILIKWEKNSVNKTLAEGAKSHLKDLQ